MKVISVATFKTVQADRTRHEAFTLGAKHFGNMEIY